MYVYDNKIGIKLNNDTESLTCNMTYARVDLLFQFGY